MFDGSSWSVYPQMTTPRSKATAAFVAGSFCAKARQIPLFRKKKAFSTFENIVLLNYLESSIELLNYLELFNITEI